MHRDLMDLHLQDLVSEIKRPKYQGSRCLAVVFERCIDEIIINPSKSLPLLVEVPEYVKRCRVSLGEKYPNYLTRAYSYLGSGLGLSGSDLAMAAFTAARSVPGADELELAAVDCREAVVVGSAGDDLLAIELAESAVEAFERVEPEGRDDCCLAFSLVVRAAMRCNALHRGFDVEIGKAVGDFSRALLVARGTFKRTTLAAASGLATALGNLWFSGCSARVAPPAVIENLVRLRFGLRRQRVRVISLADANARWALGIALWKMLGENLGPCAENLLRSARTDILEVCTKRRASKEIKDIAVRYREDEEWWKRKAAELTLDLQWCLIHDERWAEALKESSILEELAPYIDLPAAVLAMWQDALRGRSLSAELASRVMSRRGLKEVRIPSVTKDDPSPIGF